MLKGMLQRPTSLASRNLPFRIANKQATSVGLAEIVQLFSGLTGVLSSPSYVPGWTGGKRQGATNHDKGRHFTHS